MGGPGWLLEEKKNEAVSGKQGSRDGEVAWKMEDLNVKGWVENVPRYFEG